MTPSHAVLEDAPPVSDTATSPATDGPRSAIVPREREQLLPLTSLRFIAAAMVVFGHSRGEFGLALDAGGARFAWAKAVPFFFTLSGFILAYSYPRLGGLLTRRFLIARLARLWPAHAVTFALMVPIVAMSPTGVRWSAALANLSMLHAWVPYPRSYFSFNAPSWSISTEIGLYLMFPFLILDWRRTWLPKLVLAMAILTIARHIGPGLALPVSDSLGPGADIAGVMLNPLSYLYLFALGMGTSLAWQWLAPRARVGAALGTTLELVALACVVWTLLNNFSSTEALTWMLSSLGVTMANLWWVPPLDFMALSFPLFILVMALGRGLLSRALSWRLPVLLGELSFSLYLIHMPVRTYLEFARVHLSSFGAWWNALPNFVKGWEYGLGCLLAALALWWFVECPARKAARAWWQSREADVTGRQWSTTIATALVLGTLVTTANVSGLR